MTAERDAEEALDLALTEWRQVFDSMDDSVMVSTATRRRARANAATVALSGLEMGERVGSALLRTCSRTAGATPVECPRDKALLSGRSETTFVRRNGGLLRLSFKAGPGTRRPGHRGHPHGQRADRRGGTGCGGRPASLTPARQSSEADPLTISAALANSHSVRLLHVTIVARSSSGGSSSLSKAAARSSTWMGSLRTSRGSPAGALEASSSAGASSRRRRSRCGRSARPRTRRRRADRRSRTPGPRGSSPATRDPTPGHLRAPATRSSLPPARRSARCPLLLPLWKCGAHVVPFWLNECPIGAFAVEYSRSGGFERRNICPYWPSELTVPGPESRSATSSRPGPRGSSSSARPDPPSG